MSDCDREGVAEIVCDGDCVSVVNCVFVELWLDVGGTEDVTVALEVASWELEGDRDTDRDCVSLGVIV